MTTDPARPTTEELQTWSKVWKQRRAAAYQRLVKSYTPAQRAIVAEMNHCVNQAGLCKERELWPAGRRHRKTGELLTPVKWPDSPFDEVTP